MINSNEQRTASVSKLQMGDASKSDTHNSPDHENENIEIEMH